MQSAPRSSSQSSGAKGVVIAQGGGLNGWRLFAKDGRLKSCYELLGIKLFCAESHTASPAGKCRRGTETFRRVIAANRGRDAGEDRAH
jgi:hypothetical protein